jgi:hypothetical protein
MGLITYDNNKRCVSCSVNMLESAYLIRFADNFVFTSLTKHGVVIVKKLIKRFLKKRGFVLDGKKTRTITWIAGRKLNFLGWTFHLMSVNKASWWANFTNSGGLTVKNRTKLDIYPSIKSLKNFRIEIKYLLSIKNINVTPQQMIRKLNVILCR